MSDEEGQNPPNDAEPGNDHGPEASARRPSSRDAEAEMLELFGGSAELAALADHARAAGAPEADELMPWDRSFWSERLRESRYDFSDEELRPYFPMPKVLAGMFALADRLFGIRVEDATGTIPGWHEDVRYFVLSDHEGRQVASFFMDPYARSADKQIGRAHV